MGSTFVFSRIATYRNLSPRSNVVKVFKGKPSDLCHSVYRLGNLQYTLEFLRFLLFEFLCCLVVYIHCGRGITMTHNDLYILYITLHTSQSRVQNVCRKLCIEKCGNNKGSLSSANAFSVSSLL